MQLSNQAAVEHAPELPLAFGWPQAIDAALGARIIELYNDSIRTENILGYCEPLAGAEAAAVIARIDESVRKGDKRFFGIYTQDLLIGMALLTPSSLPNCRHIVEWSKGIIHSQYRGRRVLARALMELGEQCLREHWDIIVLDVRAESRAHKLWCAFGFQEYGRLADYARVDGVPRAGAYLYVTAQDLLRRLHTERGS